MWSKCDFNYVPALILLNSAIFCHIDLAAQALSSTTCLSALGPTTPPSQEPSPPPPQPWPPRSPRRPRPQEARPRVRHLNVVSPLSYPTHNFGCSYPTLIPAGKGKGKAAPSEAQPDQQVEEPTSDIFEEESAVAMASMDIFAGCGGLSEGMHQAGVAETK